MRQKDRSSSSVLMTMWGKVLAVASAKVGRCSWTVIRPGRLSSSLEVDKWRDEAGDLLERLIDIG